MRFGPAFDNSVAGPVVLLTLRKSHMNRILKLQRLALDNIDTLFGSSTGSSTSGCCNGRSQNEKI